MCKSSATHQALVTCTMLCAMWYKGTAQLLSLIELKSYLFYFISLAETISWRRRGGNQSARGGNPDSVLQKMPHTKAWKFKSQPRLEPALKHWWQVLARKTEVLTITLCVAPCWLAKVKGLLYEVYYSAVDKQTKADSSICAIVKVKIVVNCHLVRSYPSTDFHAVPEEILCGWIWLVQSTYNTQSLEFVVEMRILTEMKIENRGKINVPVGKKINRHTFFLWKFRWWICECKLKVQNWYLSWILVCYIFFKFASRMPQIAQILISTFNIFPGGEGVGGQVGGGGWEGGGSEGPLDPSIDP